MHATPDCSAAGQAYAEALHRLLPFHFFYEKTGAELPDFEFLEGEEVPYPYRSLLVHNNDMTPTLAAFHHSKLYLEVHEHESTDEFVMRLVTLHASSSDQAVEFGAIAIQLDRFSEEVRKAVVAGEKPLGGILGEFSVDHSGNPAAYFSVPADGLISNSLNQGLGEKLYGRCNQLLDSEGVVFADIVEILPRSNESENWVGTVSPR
tara:strand:+ start:1498 stop:2115 length:618 start_codon:yes stop_codon:yes gene_type:complete